MSLRQVNAEPIISAGMAKRTLAAAAPAAALIALTAAVCLFAGMWWARPESDAPEGKGKHASTGTASAGSGGARVE